MKLLQTLLTIGEEMTDSDGYEPSTAELDTDLLGGDRSTPEGADIDVLGEEELRGDSMPDHTEPMASEQADGTSSGVKEQGPVAGDSSYGPVRVTPLTQALRHDPGYLDAGRPYPRQAVSREILQAELAGGRSLKANHKDWKIDWENAVLIKRHEWRSTKYSPRRNECPIPLEWLKGRRQTLLRDRLQGDGF